MVCIINKMVAYAGMLYVRTYITVPTPIIAMSS